MIELLLTPNIAYLFIVIGLLLTVMALLTPGTGLFEVSAFFTLAVAAWQMYNLPINLWAMIVAVIGLVVFVLAIRRTGQQYVYLGASIAALVVGSAYLFKGEGLLPVVNPWLALIVSTLSAGFMWLLATKTVDVHLMEPAHDLGKLIGAVGVAKTDVHTEGTVFVHMEDWSAVSDTPIPQGSRVRVIGREGLILEVEALNESHSDPTQ